MKPSEKCGLAYGALELKRAIPQIYVCSFPDAKGNRQVSTDRGVNPLWSPDGKELFYRDGDSVIGISVETDPTFKHGKPEILFQDNYISPSLDDGQPWDIHPDGERFLMIKPVAASVQDSVLDTPRQINIIFNWFEELKKRVSLD